MSLARKVVLYLVLIQALTSGLAYGLSRVVFLPHFDRLDHEHLIANLERARGALDAEINRIRASTADWAYWTETYDFANGRNPAYLDENLMPESFSGLQVNWMLYLNPQGQLRFARAVDLETQQVLVPDPSLLEQARAMVGLLSPNDPLDEVSGVMTTAVGPALFSARWILRSDGSGPPAGVFLAGRYLDAGELSRLQAWANLPFEVWPLQNALPADVAEALANTSALSPVFVRLAPNQRGLTLSPQIWGYAVVHDPKGQPALVIRIAQQRAVYLQGVNSLRTFGILLIGLEIVLGVLILVYISQRYGRRLRSVMRGIANLREDCDLRYQLEVDGNDELATLVGMINDLVRELGITQFSLRESNRSLQQSLELTQLTLSRLNVLRQIDLAIASDIRLREKLQHILYLIRTALEVDGAALLPMEHCSLALPGPLLSEGLDPDILLLIQRLPQDFLQEVQREGRAQILPEEGLVLLHAEPLQTNQRLNFLAAAPLVTQKQNYGLLLVLVVHDHPRPVVDDAWRSFLESIALQTAIGLENAQLLLTAEHLNAELQAAIEATLEGWARTLELRDRETQGHSERVVRLSLALGQHLGLPAKDLEDLRYGALLHDIGKIGIPDSILFKPGPLSAEDWDIMRQHPRWAYEMLKDVPFLKGAVDILYAHHERWDGSGYPRGLKGEEIPLGARIFAVVDVWDALTSDRPYRPAWSPARALEYLQEQAGVQFDPRVVQAFVDLLAQQPELVRETLDSEPVSG